MKQKIRILICFVLLLLINLEIKGEEKILSPPEFITPEQLIRNMQTDHYIGKPISIQYNKENLYIVLLQFSKFSGISFYIDSNIKEIKISGIIANIPWDHALDVFLYHNDLEAVLEGEIIRIKKIKSLLEVLLPYLIILLIIIILVGIILIKRKKSDRKRKDKINKNGPINPIYAGQCLKRVINLLESKNIYRDETLSLKKLAKMLSIPPYQLSIIINEKMDMSWSQLVNKYRIDEAKKLLLEPKNNKKILDIALSVGFNNKTHFNKTFKEYTNQTPSQFRDNKPKSE